MSVVVNAVVDEEGQGKWERSIEGWDVGALATLSTDFPTKGSATQQIGGAIGSRGSCRTTERVLA